MCNTLYLKRLSIKHINLHFNQIVLVILGTYLVELRHEWFQKTFRSGVNYAMSIELGQEAL